MDFGLLPPEINSGLIYAGPGSGPLTAAASAWDTLSQGLAGFVAEVTAVIGNLTSTWRGPSSTAMQTAAQPYLAWLTTSATQAETTATQARAAAGAFETARAASVPPPAIAANRAQLLALVATNLLGQNTAAIAASEAAYAEMWAQDAAAMNAYAAASSGTVSALPKFSAAPQTASGSAPAATGAATTAVGAQSLFDDLFGNGTTLGQNWQALVSSGFPVDVAQLFANFIALQQVAASNIMRNSIPIAVPAPPAPQVIVPAAPTPATPKPMPVSGAPGVSYNIGRLSVPPSWARPPEPGIGKVTVDTRSGGQAVLPAVPFMPVTGLRSNQGKIRPEPEYGHVSKVLPPRNPSAG